MKNILLSEDQFSISIGMSEAKILKIEYQDNKLVIIARDVELLCDFNELEFYSPEISYDQWLNDKYQSNTAHAENFDHVSFFEEVIFYIPNPRIYYEGSQTQFIDLLGEFDFKDYNSYPYSYIFGGTLDDSNHDEFEVCNNQPIMIMFDDEKLERFIKRARDLGESRIIEKIYFDSDREQKRQKLSKKNNFSKYHQYAHHY